MNRRYSRDHIGMSMALFLIGLALLSIDKLGATFDVFARSTASSELKLETQDDIDKSINKTSNEIMFRLNHSSSSNPTVVGLVDYCVGDSYAPLKKLIAYNRQLYANKWNYTIFSGNVHVFPAQVFIEPRAWLKAAYFYQLLTSAQTRDVDWFLWVDCDALITRFDLSVNDVLNDLNTMLQHDIVVAEDPHTEFNSGVMFVRNSKWSRDLWSNALQKASNVSVREHKWWEQQALLELYRENSHQEKDRIFITPHRWKINAFQTFRRHEFNASSFILHRVNCRKQQPECNNLFVYFFCLTMPNGTYPENLVNCSNANETLLVGSGA